MSEGFIYGIKYLPLDLIWWATRRAKRGGVLV